MSRVIEEALRMRLAQIDQELIGKPGTVNMGLNDFLKNAIKAADESNAALARFRRIVDTLLHEKSEIEAWLKANTEKTEAADTTMSDTERQKWYDAAEAANDMGVV